jgi:uncharacterized protein YjiS (DUF1127 family)
MTSLVKFDVASSLSRNLRRALFEGRAVADGDGAEARRSGWHTAIAGISRIAAVVVAWIRWDHDRRKLMMMSDYLLADIGIKRQPEVSLPSQRGVLWRL